MAALHGTFSFAQMHNVAKGIAEYLHFDVATLLDKFFDQQRCVAKCGQGFFGGHRRKFH